MVKTQEEDIELEILKHNNKTAFLKAQSEQAAIEHQQKMERLNKILEIAIAGGSKLEKGEYE